MNGTPPNPEALLPHRGPALLLDRILELYIEDRLSADEIIGQGFPEKTVRSVLHTVNINEYKRRQAAVGIRITPRGFGKDWRYPITSAWNEWESVGSPPRSN